MTTVVTLVRIAATRPDDRDVEGDTTHAQQRRTLYRVISKAKWNAGSRSPGWSSA